MRARTFLLLVALVPALLLGPAFDGAVAWVHSHGPWEGHLHLLSEEQGLDVAELGGWHDTEHRREHPQHDDEREGHGGLLIDLSALLASAVRASVPVPFSAKLAMACSAVRRFPACVQVPLRPRGTVRSGWPPRIVRRTGVVALLRSSHAILI